MNRDIGALRETELHGLLKAVYAGRGGRTEVEVDGFVIDAVTADGERVEVQLGSFAPLRKKAKSLAGRGGLVVVRPIIVVKTLEFLDADGAWLSRKRSNHAGSAWDVFRGLVYAPELPLVPGLEVELALVDVEETRVRDGLGSWRMRGVSVRGRRLLALRERVRLSTPADYLRFVPFARAEEFTSMDLRERAGLRASVAGKALYVLSKLGVVERTGKRGNAHLYRLLVGPRARKWKKPR